MSPQGTDLDVVVASGDGVFPWGVTQADIGVRDGRIVAIAEPGALTGAETVDARGKLVLPGAIDVHVHLREPGLSHKEDFAHGTRAAAFGGVTTICDMPNNKPAPTTVAGFREKLALVAPRAHVDFGLWAGGVNVDQLRGMAEAGACGLKIYMIQPRSKTDAYQDDLCLPDDGVLLDLMRESAELGWTVCIHVENEALALRERDRLQAAGRQDARAVYESYRGPSAVEAIGRVLLLAQHTGARLHVAHLSLGNSDCVAELRRARANGVRVTTEIPPPCLHVDELERLRAYGLPFICDDREMEIYWAALADGTIDAIGTDHAPHTREEKDAADVWLAPTGYPGVETSLPLMLDAALNGRIGVERVVELMSSGPADALGIARKGRLAIGHDADVVVFDPEGSWTIDQEQLHSKAKWSPFHGRRLRGRLLTTMLRGQVLVQDGKLVEERPVGRQVGVAGAGRS